MSELPKDLKQKIYTEFLFKDFMYLFRNYFVFQTNQDGKNINTFKVQDSKELSFVCAFLQRLEPRKYDKGEIILSELEDIEEMIFIVAGEYGIGYEFNKIECFGKKMGRKTVIADYYCMFKKRSEFVFRCFKPIDAFTIRKTHMMDIFSKTKKYGDIINTMKTVTF
jgi:hypothetical protein